MKSSILGDLSVADYQGGECLAILDTETTGLPPHGLIYDIGISFLEIQGKDLVLVGKHGVLIEEIYTNPKLMRKAYFVNKVMSHYPYLLQSGIEGLRPWELACNDIAYHFKKFRVKKIGAYNANFDQRMLSATSIFLDSCDLFANYLWFDLWQISCNTVLQDHNFINWAIARGFISEKGNVLTSAEVCYQFITNKPFIEDHTALSDSVIEAEIAVAIHKKVGLSFFTAESMHGSTWQQVNNREVKAKVAKAKRLDLKIRPSEESRY